MPAAVEDGRVKKAGGVAAGKGTRSSKPAWAPHEYRGGICPPTRCGNMNFHTPARKRGSHHEWVQRQASSRKIRQYGLSGSPPAGMPAEGSMNRRELLRGLPAVPLGATALASGPSAAAELAGARQRPVPELDGELLVNRDRAHDVLEQYGLAGLVALDPINVYYLTNVTTIGVKFRTEYPGFAAYARDPEQPIFLVAGSSAAWGIANEDRETAELMPYGFSGWNAAEFNSDGLPVEPASGSTRQYHVRDDVTLTPREQRWAAAQEKYAKDIAAGAAWGLARALKAQGIVKGRVAVDDMRIAAFLAETDLVDVECVPGYGIFQLIRMVKSEQELAYQRIGGRNNGEAALATIAALAPGMTTADVEQIFRVECAIRGNDVASVIVGLPSGGGFPDGELVAGKPFLLDAVSHFREYHGDIARTFIVGDPPASVLKRHRANQLARAAVFDAIKPGVKFSTLRDIGLQTMVKNGIPGHAAFVTPHTVGLQHDDNPRRLPAFDVAAIDHVLEENMVLTVDLPYLEVGWGSGHNEDLFRVTATGYEPLNSERDPLIVL